MYQIQYKLSGLDCLLAGVEEPSGTDLPWVPETSMSGRAVAFADLSSAIRYADRNSISSELRVVDESGRVAYGPVILDPESQVLTNRSTGERIRMR